jgi:hypothetical protein
LKQKKKGRKEIKMLALAMLIQTFTPSQDIFDGPLQARLVRHSPIAFSAASHTAIGTSNTDWTRMLHLYHEFPGA